MAMEKWDLHPIIILRRRGTTDPGRLVLTFPYGTRIKGELDKSHRHFDYKLDALFNKKLRQAMQTVVYFNSLFPDATKLTKDLVLQELKRRQKTR